MVFASDIDQTQNPATWAILWTDGTNPLTPDNTNILSAQTVTFNFAGGIAPTLTTYDIQSPGNVLSDDHVATFGGPNSGAIDHP